MFSSSYSRGRHLCTTSKARFRFLPPDSWPGSDTTTGMIFRSPGNSPHSSWAAATSWSPVWRDCGPEWTGWFCPCTAVDAGWFLPAPSGLPLTAILKFTHLTNGYKSKKWPYNLVRGQQAAIVCEIQVKTTIELAKTRIWIERKCCSSQFQHLLML